MKNKRIMGHLLLFTLLGMILYPSAGWGGTMDTLFEKKDWKEIDKLLADPVTKLTPREESLGANALWLQNRWKEAEVLLKKSSSFWPEEVRPYGTLLSILALERTNRKDQAAALASEFLPSAPPDVAYYVAYALYRLTDEKDEKEKRKHLVRMYKEAENVQQQTTALNMLLKLPGDKTAYALNLLTISPRNSTALKALEASGQKGKTDVRFALGYGAYLRGQFDRAISYLKDVPLDSRNGRKARYYRAYSLYRKKKYGEALELWSPLARTGADYAESSIRRISILAEKAQKERALRVLREVAESREGIFRARALYSLSTHASGKERTDLEDKVIAGAPDSILATRILWNRGWKNWRDGNALGAVKNWEKSVSPEMPRSWRARVLYWEARAYEKLGRVKEQNARLQTLRKEFPLSVYASLTAEKPLSLLPGGPPSLAGLKPIELERWGFVSHARRKLILRGDPPSLYRAARIAAWQDDSLGIYALAGKLSREITAGPAFYREAMEFLYPRPFRDTVKRSAERFSVEDNLVWAIMRQESAFNPTVTSWAGAAGLMQLMPGTAAGEAKSLGMKKYSLYSPEDNITMGTAHIARLLKSFSRAEHAVAAYNAGGGSARRWLDGRKDLPLDEWIEAVAYEETNDYVQKVMANLAVYRALYGAPPLRADSTGTVSPAEVEEMEEVPDTDEREEPLPVDDGGK
ncbi:MAG: transglycosylase SLT domain-containing protein [Synergistaceae bacterium]|nr:transglycosylase SLT domain-containing protein [Synergistaceae bacterium]